MSTVRVDGFVTEQNSLSLLRKGIGDDYEEIMYDSFIRNDFIHKRMQLKKRCGYRL